MVTKIRSGRVTNVDHVLEIHNDFLTTCMNDCMLSSPQLLTQLPRPVNVPPAGSKVRLGSARQ